ncbi:MAG: 6-phosphofructokinase [Candidatus Peribacteraceae bacterium]|jgi:6-phosphofructokinase 1
MKIALLQGGGTCPGSNAAHYGLTQTATKEGHEVVVIPEGYKGLITPEQEYRDIFSYPLVQQRGLDALFLEPGSLPHTSRTKPIPVNTDGNIIQVDLEVFHRNAEVIQENLTRNRVDILAIVGGDDTLWRGASMLHRYDILKRRNAHGKSQTVQAVGVPKTIDNDFLRIAYSFGATTAALCGQHLVREGRVEAENCQKVMIIEAMGRDCGWLAAASAENADGVLIPEMELSEDEVVCAIQQKIRSQGKALVLVVAEGYPIDGMKIHLAGLPDAFGHMRLGGVRGYIERWLNNANISTMQLCPGYLFRSGPPTTRDAAFARRLGNTAMQAALKGEDGVIAHLPEGSRSLEDTLALMDMATIRGGKNLDPTAYDPETLRYTKPLMPEPERPSWIEP